MTADARFDHLAPDRRALLEARLRKLGDRGRAAGIPRLPRGSALPLSFAQQRLWFLDQLEPGSVEYNAPQALRVHGTLDVEALERALTGVVARHETLRTTFATVDGDPVQVIHDPAEVALEVTELSHLDGEKRELEAHALAAAEAQRPFDLERGPLLRARVLRLDRDDHVLLLNMHHIVSDGWSRSVLLNELTALYDAHASGEPARLPDLSIQYADFAVWQRRRLSGDVLEAQLGYWRERLAGLPPALELPADRPRPAVRSGRGSTVSFDVDVETLGALETFGRAHNATLFMTLTAAFQALLSRYSGSDDVAIGTPVAGRSHPEAEALIGFFVNTLVLRTDLSGDPTFSELVGRVRDVALGAFAHQDVPFEKLVEELHPQRSSSHTPLFQVMLSLDNTAEGSLKLRDAEVETFARDSTTAKFDLTLGIVEDGSAVVEYSTDLFDVTTIERMVTHFTTLLEAAAADPSRRLSELDVIGPRERHHVVVELNDTAADFPDDRCVHELFEARALENPDAVALSFGDQDLTYSDLDRRANRLAHHLVEKGAGPDVPVGICLERGADLVVGLLAISKAGGAYVPLDPDYPAERLAFMLRDTGAPVVVTTPDLAGRLHTDAELVLVGDAAISARPETSPAVAVSPDDLAYVIYTSGSTGTPKGVAVTHRSLVNLVSWHTTTYGVTSEDRATHLAPLGFDASVWELWPYLSAGATLVLAPEHVRTSPAELVEWLGDSGITVTFLPTALVHEVFAAGLHGGLRARTIVTGGDQLRVRPDDQTSFALVNHYGPTETTVVATAGAVEQSGAAPPSIGRPISNTTIYVLDSYGNPVPVRIPGELYVGGAGVARGYVKRPGLTAERFVPDPFSGVPGARLYRTGDRARYLEDGSIEFLGRVDHQVKIRGFRIEPGEIEARLVAHDAVRDAVVVAHGEGPDKRLVAYVVGDRVPTTTELRGYLSKTLPTHMVPAHFVVLDELPLTPNGKVDRAALPGPDGGSDSDGIYAPPRTPAEEALVEIWCDVLGLERAGINDDFFELGGHSLLAARVVAHANRRGLALTVRDVFEHPRLNDLARLAETGTAEDYDWESPISFGEAGDREAVMLVNPVNVTTPYWYAGLAKELGERHSSFALQPLAGERSAGRLVTIEQMAEKCIDDLTNLRPEGPYVVGGWSLGATVAWDVAARQHAAGRAPRALVLVDPPGLEPREEPSGATVRDVDAWGREVFSVLEDGDTPMIDDRRRVRLGRLFEQGGLPADYLDLQVSDLVRFVDGYRMSAWAQERYDYPAYPGDVILFVSTVSVEAVTERVEAWRSLVAGDLVAYVTDASHDEILLGDHARAVATAIAAHLQGDAGALDPSPLLRPIPGAGGNPATA